MVDFLAALPADGLREGELRLRRWRMRDASAVHAACQDPDIARFTHVPSPYTLDDARRFLAASIGRGRHGSLPLAVVDAGADELLGSIGLRAGPYPHIGELGYWLTPGGRGRGLATRAVLLLARWAFDDLQLARVQLMTFLDNEASQRVAERAGFTREGVLRAWAEHGGELVDHVMFSLLPGDLRHAGAGEGPSAPRGRAGATGAGRGAAGRAAGGGRGDAGGPALPWGPSGGNLSDR